MLKKTTISLTDPELAAVLAGLRLLVAGAEEGNFDAVALADILTDCGKFKPLSVVAIDKLCERLNVSGEEDLADLLEEAYLVHLNHSRSCPQRPECSCFYGRVGQALEEVGRAVVV